MNCPECGSDNVEELVDEFYKYRCLDCGHKFGREDGEPEEKEEEKEQEKEEDEDWDEENDDTGDGVGDPDDADIIFMEDDF